MQENARLYQRDMASGKGRWNDRWNIQVLSPPPLDRSIEYVKTKKKPHRKPDSLEAAIDYAMNRTKDGTGGLQDTIGCTNENACADMVATKKRFHKMGGVEGYHLGTEFAKVK